MGVILPRRIVRRITLLPGPVSSGSIARKSPYQLVEIETYGAFAMRSAPVRFQVPLDRVRALNSRTDKMQHLQFFVQGVPFRYIIEKQGAEFGNPQEYDFMFAVHKD
ncbi:unnamed protein product [Echinostoma caproni]|uniref:Uma2 domain-containing protein n=1 Tax=Echinostoma caproni TaxID=27848 RepID=A0A183B4K6_9TREM|nr:unnamed protein product [Echinostoma caproni]